MSLPPSDEHSVFQKLWTCYITWQKDQGQWVWSRLLMHEPQNRESLWFRGGSDTIAGISHYLTNSLIYGFLPGNRTAGLSDKYVSQ